EHEARAGLGNYIILDHIRRAAQAELPYVYLGYWVEGSARMQYKIRYRPLERLGPAGWERFSPEQQSALISSVAEARREEAMVVSGGSKDGAPGGQRQYKLV